MGRDPRQIDFSVDEGNIVTDLTWTTWSSSGAVGVGRSDADSCVPNCAVAPVQLEATTVTLSAPVDGHFSVITEVRGGRTERFTYPASWPVGAARSTPTPTPNGTPTGTAPGTPNGTPTGTASGTPTGTASGTPTGTPTGTASGTSPSVSSSTAATPTDGTGTAVLDLSGAVTGRIADAVTSCHPRPAGESTVSVSGTLNGIPWLLSVASFEGENGVWRVRAGPSGTASGSSTPGYGVVATYPATVPGATAVDWSRGMTLDVRLMSLPGQRPQGSVTVRGTLTCT